MRTSKVLVMLTIFMLVGPAKALDPDYEILLEKYNQKYSDLMQKQSAWPLQIEKIKLSVANARTEYQESVSGAESSYIILGVVNQDLENQVGHLEFLKEVEPVSTDTQKNIQKAAVAAGEFNKPKDVTTLSLSKKAGKLNKQIEDLASKIAGKEFEISQIEGSPAYTALVASKISLEKKKALKHSELHIVGKTITDLNWTLEIHKGRLRASQERQKEAQKKVITIQSVEIPSKELAIDGFRSNIKDVKLRRKERRERLKTVRKNRKATNKLIGKKEKDLNKPDADKAIIELELIELRKKLNKQDQRIITITGNIDSDTGEIKDLKGDITDAQGDIDDLRAEALAQNKKAGEEAIDQIDIKSDIGDVEKDISEKDLEVISLKASISSLEKQITSAQGDINDYRKIHIAPIETVISGLSKKKSEISKRRSQLLSWKEQIETQDANIAKASTLIKDQLLVVKKAVDLQAERQAIYDKSDQVIAKSELALNSEIRSHNALSVEIKGVIEEFKIIEEQVLQAKQNLLNKEVEDAE